MTSHIRSGGLADSSSYPYFQCCPSIYGKLDVRSNAEIFQSAAETPAILTPLKSHIPASYPLLPYLELASCATPNARDVPTNPCRTNPGNPHCSSANLANGLISELG